MTDKKDGSSQGEGDSIRVMIRVRPAIPGAHEDSCLEIDNSRNAIRMFCKPEPKVFTYDQIADNDATQDSIFDSVGKRVIESCMAGYNGTIFAYGQTGSGKTYTMLGPSEDSDNFQHQLRGVIPRSFEYLFNLMQREYELHGEKVQFLCKCSFLEIYNEQIFDLLDTASNGLQLREDIKRGVFVDGLIEQTVADACEAYEVLSSGWMNRTVASTSMNRESSRSHAVFTVVIESKENKNGVWSVRKSFLNLVDLAGSERQKDTQTTGVRLKEAGKINKSLSVLGNVIMALVDIAHGKSRHVPYRDSKLSFLLRDSLGGNAKTQMIACIHPGARSFGETLSTLMFARRAKMIKNKAVVNEDSHGSVVHLQSEIKRLKEMLSQFQSGQIPTQLSDPDNPCEGETDTGDNKWKERFLQAMYLRAKEETKASTLQEELKNLKDLCNAKDKVIQNNKMILKFRDSALQRMESAHKEKVKLSQDDKDKIIESHQQERKTWQDTYSCHPDAKSYKIAYERLLKEVKALRSEENSTTIDKRKANELLKLFEELSQEDNDFDGPRQTPQQQQNQSFTERQKAEMGKLEAECEKLNQQITELAEKFTNSEAELKAAKASKQKAESLLEAHHMRSQADRDTIKSLTPKKSCVKWQLRNRPVVVSAPSTPVPRFHLDELGEEPEEELLTDQPAPTEFSEDRVKELIEQMEKLSSELLNTKSELDSKDKQILQLVEEKSLLESSRDHLSKTLESDKTKSEEQMEKLTTEMTAIREEMRYVTENRNELDIMTKHSEKRMKELTVERNNLGQYVKKCSSLETENLKLGTELSNLKRQEETVREEMENLQVQLETAQATLGFQEGQLQDKENQLDILNKEMSNLSSKLQDLTNQVQQSEDKRADLAEQLHRAGDKEQQIADALQKVDASEREVQQRDVLIREAGEERSSLLKEREALTAEVESLKKIDTDKREYIKCLTEKVTLMKTDLQQSNMDAEEKQTNIEELLQEKEVFKQNMAELEEKIVKDRNDRESTEKLLVEKMKDSETTLRTVSKQLEDANEEKESLCMELQSAQQLHHELMETNEGLIGELKKNDEKVDSLNAAIKEKENTIHDMKNAQLLEKDAEIASVMEENHNLMTKIAEKETRYQKLSDAFDSVSKLQKQCHNENWELTSRSSFLEQQCREFEVKNSDLTVELNTYQLRENEYHDQICELHEQLKLSENDAAEAIDSRNNIENELKSTKTQLNLLQDQLDATVASIAEEQNDIDRLKQEMIKKQNSHEELEKSICVLEESLGSMTKEKEELEEKIKYIEDNAAALAGHQNHKQRIHYLQNKNAELNEAKERVRKVECDNIKLKELLRVQKLGGSTSRLTPVKGAPDHVFSTPGKQPPKFDTPKSKSHDIEKTSKAATPLSKDQSNIIKENLEPSS